MDCVGLFAYKIYDSINGPIKFNQTKNRYAKVIDRLKDIRKSQIAHKDVKGVFSNNLTVVKFIDEELLTLIEKRDSLIWSMIEPIVSTCFVRSLSLTPSTVSFKDSLFKNSTRYQDMAYIPIDGVRDSVFTINAEVINKNGYKVPVFEVKVSKSVILFDQDTDLVQQENETVSVDGVNGPAIVLGSLSNVSTNGNWPTIFDAKQE